eukprot:5873197-Pleurochrysis_carterae.AAC.1
MALPTPCTSFLSRPTWRGMQPSIVNACIVPSRPISRKRAYCLSSTCSVGNICHYHAKYASLTPFFVW